MSLSTPPPDAWGKDFDLDGQNPIRDWETRYTSTRNGPNQTPPHKSANVSVRIPLWRQAQLQEFVDDPAYGYGGSIPALARDGMAHRMMEMVEHRGASPKIEAIIRRLQWEQEEEDQLAFFDHIEARKDATRRRLELARGRSPVEEIDTLIANVRQRMQDDAWPPIMIEEMEQILVPAETAAHNPLRSVK
jgi:hypothetical protein